MAKGKDTSATLLHSLFTIVGEEQFKTCFISHHEWTVVQCHGSLRCGVSKLINETVSPQVENLATSCVVDGAAGTGDDPDIVRHWTW